jgi:RND family efflux transporter MFP subunit
MWAFLGSLIMRALRNLLRVAVPAAGLLAAMGLVIYGRAIEARLPRLAASSTVPVQNVLAEPSRVVAEGRLVAYPGAEVVVSTEAVGRIVRLEVVEKSVVHKGDLIAELNADDLRADLAETAARVAEAGADIRFYEREVRREESLIARRAGTAQTLDADRRSLETALARRAAALAEGARTRALLDKTRILAPIDGVITARHTHAGETVEVAARIVTIADLTRLRIEAEVDEFDTGQVALGAPVRITAEGFPGASWRGSIEEVPDSVVPRRNRPEDPGRPIDARVLPVKVAFGESTPLKLGQRVEVEVLPGEGP